MRFFYGLIHGKSALEAVDAADLLFLVDERLRKKYNLIFWRCI